MVARTLTSPDTQLAIGVDLGGTHVRAALVDARGTIRARVEERTEATAGPDRVLAQIRRMTDALLPDVQGQVTGIGVSTPGPVDTVVGVAKDIPTLAGFAGYPLRAELQKRYPFPVSLENDGIAAAVGEWRFGAGQGVDNLVYLTISTGIGGGVVADGRVLRGRMGMAGHVGHMSIAPGGAPCLCGGRGCFEAYGSGTALAARASIAASACGDTLLGGNGRAVDSRAVFAAARTGDRLANRLVDEEAEILGRGITNLLHIFSPEVVIVGGGLSEEFDRLRPGIQDYIAKFAMPAFRDVDIVKAALGQNSGLVGAAALALLASAGPQQG